MLDLATLHHHLVVPAKPLWRASTATLVCGFCMIDEKRRAMSKFAWAVCLGIALIFLAARQGLSEEPRRVLLLHAFGHAYSPWSDFAANFRAELIKKSPGPIDLFEVSLDTTRVQDP